MELNSIINLFEPLLGTGIIPNTSTQGEELFEKILKSQNRIINEDGFSFIEFLWFSSVIPPLEKFVKENDPVIPNSAQDNQITNYSVTDGDLSKNFIFPNSVINKNNNNWVSDNRESEELYTYLLLPPNLQLSDIKNISFDLPLSEVENHNSPQKEQTIEIPIKGQTHDSLLRLNLLIDSSLHLKNNDSSSYFIETQIKNNFIEGSNPSLRNNDFLKSTLLKEIIENPPFLKINFDLIEKPFDGSEPFQQNQSQNKEVFKLLDPSIMTFIPSEEVGEERPYFNFSEFKKEILSPKVDPIIKNEMELVLDKDKEVFIDNRKKPIPCQNVSYEASNLGKIEKIFIPLQLSKPGSEFMIKVDPSEAYHEIEKHILFFIKNNEEKIRLILEPPELGMIHIEIKNDKRNIELLLWTNQEETKNLLELNRTSLVKALQEDGFRLEKIDIFFQPNWEILEDGRGDFIDRERRLFKETRKNERIPSEEDMTIESIFTNFHLTGNNYIDLMI